MKGKLRQHLMFVLPAIILMLTLTTVPSAFAGDVSPPEVWIGSDSISVLPPMNDGNITRLRLIVATPGGTEEYTSAGEEIVWYSGGQPDGSCRFEADVLSLDENGEKDGAMVRGTFRISNGSIVQEQEGDELEQESDEAAGKQSGLTDETGLFETAMVAVLNFLVPTAHAADLTVSDYSPELEFEDTSAEGSDTDGREWVIMGEDSSLRIYDDTADTSALNYTSVIRIEALGEYGGHSSMLGRYTENSIVIEDNGDMSFADGQMFLDRDITGDPDHVRLGIGTHTPVTAIHGKTTSGKAHMYLRFENTAESTWDLGQDEYGNFDINIAANGNSGPTGHMLTILDENGWVGLNTSTPQGNLHINSPANEDTFAGMGPNIVAGPGFNYGYAGSTFGRGAGFFNVRPDASATGINPSLRFMTVNLERMVVTNAGNVGINNSAPASRLHVNGSVRVTGGSFIDDGTTLNVPDYVFEDGYQLMPLGELSTYLDEHKHLPGVKSSKEIADDGLDLGSSQMALLEKVEELTLYTLQQQNQLNNKKQQLEDQAQRIAKLESMVDHLSQAIKTIK